MSSWGGSFAETSAWTCARGRTAIRQRGLRVSSKAAGRGTPRHRRCSFRRRSQHSSQSCVQERHTRRPEARRNTKPHLRLPIQCRGSPNIARRPRARERHRRAHARRELEARARTSEPRAAREEPGDAEQLRRPCGDFEAHRQPDSGSDSLPHPATAPRPCQAPRATATRRA